MVQAAVQSLQAEVTALKGAVAEKDGQIERWRAEAVRAQKALEAGSGSAQEASEQVRMLQPLCASHTHQSSLRHLISSFC
jgi:hypothetical protein